MQSLRTLTFLPRLLLLWFVVSLGAAVASPMVRPQLIEMVCGGVQPVKLVLHGEDGPQDLPAASMDCPLCTPAGAPPPTVAALRLPAPLPLGHAVQPIPAARLAAATAAPLPARGPPAAG